MARVDIQKIGYFFDPIEQETLVTDCITYSSSGFRVKPDIEPVVLLLSCLSITPDFVNAYMNFIDVNRKEILKNENGVPFCWPFKHGTFIPEDVCITVAAMLFLSIAKNIEPMHWETFSKKRMVALRSAYRVTTGFEVYIPLSVVSGLTEKIK